MFSWVPYGTTPCYSQIWKAKGANALFWTPGFSLQPSTERPELKKNKQTKPYQTSLLLFKKQVAGELSQSGVISGVHTAPRTGQRWSWHRKEKDWRLLWTALPLTKEALQKDHGRTLNSCQHYFFAAVLLHSEINQCQKWSIQELFSLHKSCSSGACALCAADSKSSVRALILVIFIYEIHLHSIKHFCFSICLMSSPASTSLFPSTTFCSWLFFLSFSFFLSSEPCGSSVITVIFGMRRIFHRGTGGGWAGCSSGHARVLVSRTTWLCSRERPYWRRTSEDTFCLWAQIVITQK